MITRFLSAILLAGMLAVGGVQATTPVHAADPVVSVTPSSGSQDLTFVFTGTGFTPGSIVQATFTSPDGTDVTFYFAGTTTPYFVTTADDGTWTFTLQPATDLAGHQAGVWTAKLCISDGSGCYTGTFEITL
jgi:hypothetical protein